MTIVSRLAISACAAFASGLMPVALAETFPARPVRVVVGPGSDFPPRLIGQKLAGVWGQQVVVDQRPGGGGAIALDISAKSAPDGYTWLISTAAFTINIVHVPYKSAIAATTDLLGGHVQLSFQYAPTALPQVKSGKLRALAVSSAKRSLTAPELPTVAESGLPGFEVIGWNGVHVPAGTPRPIIAKLNKDIVAALALPDVRERMLGAGLETAGNTPEEFAAFVKTDLAHWAKLIEQTGIRAE